MSSKLRQGLAILREEGAIPFLSDAASYVRRANGRRYARLRFDPSSPECHVVDEDWDNLVILDACRFDQFERLHDIDGRLETRTSLGSCTPEFLEHNFEGGTYHDTVYVTSNPMYCDTGLGEVFHDVVDVWETDWDERNQTVHPGEMVEATIDAYETYPDKRIISHFIQPHYPFIGGSATTLTAEANSELTGIEWIYSRSEGERAKRHRATPWDLLDEGELDEQLVWEAYDENLEIVLPHVEELLDHFDEKTVVTSDHGNLVGKRLAPFDRPRYGHPPETYTEELRKVPWLVVDGERRKDIRAEAPTTAAETEGESAVVADRLADLGYAET